MYKGQYEVFGQVYIDHNLNWIIGQAGYDSVQSTCVNMILCGLSFLCFNILHDTVHTQTDLV